MIFRFLPSIPFLLRTKDSVKPCFIIFLLYVCSLFFVYYFFYFFNSGLFGGPLWHFLGFLSPGHRLFSHVVRPSRWWLFHIILWGCLPGLFFFHVSIFLFCHCLCKFWLFSLALSWQGFFPLNDSCLWFPVASFLHICNSLWIFRLGFNLAQGYFSSWISYGLVDFCLIWLLPYLGCQRSCF